MYKAANVEMTGQDALLLILIADGETGSASDRFVQKLIDSSYTVMGAAIVTDTINPLTPPRVMVDVMIDSSYNNA